MKGFPDIGGILQKAHPGRFFAVELKTAKNNLTPDQIIWRNKILASGAAYAVVRSLDELINFLSELGEIESR